MAQSKRKRKPLHEWKFSTHEITVKELIVFQRTMIDPDTVDFEAVAQFIKLRLADGDVSDSDIMSLTIEECDYVTRRLVDAAAVFTTSMETMVNNAHYEN